MAKQIPGLYDKDNKLIKSWPELEKLGLCFNGELGNAGILYDNGLTGKIVLPEKIRVLSDFAFACCNSLTEIVLPSRLEKIGNCAFIDCMNLKTVTIPPTVSSIGTEAFSNCIALERINIPFGLQTLSSCLFKGCTKLKEITIPANIAIIQDHAFEFSGIEKINMVEGLRVIEDYAFHNCLNLRVLAFPRSLIKIGKYAFDNCARLAKVIFPTPMDLSILSPGEVSIPKNTFGACPLLEKIITHEFLDKFNVEFYELNKERIYKVKAFTVEELTKSGFSLIEAKSILREIRII